MTMERRLGLLLLLLSGGISFFFGFTVARTASGAPDFKPTYYGARCLLQHRNPYNASELESMYRADGQAIPSDPVQRHRSIRGSAVRNGDDNLADSPRRSVPPGRHPDVENW
jgi:hypothetical protein